MNQANISYTRNHLSQMIAQVKEGESVLIVDRDQPVARLEPVGTRSDEDSAWRANLEKRGLVRRASRQLDLKAFSALALPVPRDEGDVLRALLDERRDSR